MKLRTACVLLCTVAGLHAAAASGMPERTIELVVAPSAGTIDVTYAAAVTAPVELSFRLAPTLVPRSLEVAGESVSIDGSAGHWRASISGNGRVPISLRYTGGLEPFPPPAADPQLGVAKVGKAGAYLPGGSGWLPLRHGWQPSTRLTVRLPHPYRAVASGKLSAEQQDASGVQTVFDFSAGSESPSLFAGVWRTSERWLDGVRLRTYFDAQVAVSPERYLDAAASYLTRYSNLIGPYPFADFSVVASPLPVGLGFPGLAYVGSRVLNLPYMQGRSLAHEVLHNWWGNGVRIADEGGNWSEALTTFQADDALAEGQGVQPAREMRLGWLRDYAALPVARDAPLGDFRGKVHDASQVLGYGKGAFVFFMLRAEIGTAAFDEGLRMFWARHRGSRAGWRDLQRAFEQASASELSWYFDQWLERFGAPRIQLFAAHTSKDPESLHLTLGQKLPPYLLTVPVVIETAAGSHKRMLPISGPSSTGRIEVPGEILGVSVDPDFEIFRRLSAGEAPTILRDVTLREAACVVLSNDESFRAAARGVAARLMDTPVHCDADEPSGSAVLIIADESQRAALLATLGTAVMPSAVDGEGTARVWTQRLTHDAVALVIVAHDAPALTALGGPLPHYGRQSYLIFDAGHVTRRGVWPITQRSVPVEMMD